MATEDDIKAVNEAIAEQVRLQKEAEEAFKDQTKALKELLQAEKMYEIAVKTNAANTEELARELEVMRKSLLDNEKTLDEYNQGLKDNIQILEERKRKLEEQINVQEKLKKGVSTTIQTIEKFTLTNFQSMASVDGLVGSIADFSKMLDQTQVGLARTTGFGTAFRDNLNAIFRENRNLALSYEESAQILGSLSTGMARFNALSDQQQNAIGSVTGRFLKLGASTEETAMMFDRLNYSFGLTGNAALAAANDIESLSETIGRPIDMVIKDLNDLGPELARFGAQGISVFEKLSIQARRLGLTTRQAFDVSELFDTFEGAAQVAGRLNAQLGLQLNSVELMRASSEERVELLRQEFALQGRNIASMGRRQQQMIASILQTDVETARRLLGEGMDITAFQREVAVTPEQKILNFITKQEQALSLQQSVLSPLAETLTSLNTAIKNLNTWLSNFGPQILAALGTVAAGSLAVGGLRAGGRLLGGAGGMLKGAGRLFTAGRMGLKFGGIKGATDALSKAYSRMGTQKAASTALKAGAKKLPFGIGLLASLPFAASRAMQGDLLGAGGEALSGALSIVPGFGTAGSFAVDAALAGRDVFSSSAGMPSTRATAMPRTSSRSTDGSITVKEMTLPIRMVMDGREMGTVVEKIMNVKLDPVRPN